MKKRILYMLLATMVMGILTGCGVGLGDDSANASAGIFGAEEITVSEMINSFAEEDNNGEFVVYTFSLREEDVESIVDEEITVTDVVLNNKIVTGRLTIYDNEKCVTRSFYNEQKKNLENIVMLEDREMYLSELTALDPLSDDLVSGEFDVKRSKDSLYFATYKDSDIILSETYCGKFGNTFERIEIEGKSYMVFPFYSFRGYDGKIIGIACTMIEDTDYTKDKIIVLDTLELLDTFETKGYTGILEFEQGDAVSYYEKQLPVISE